MPNTREKLIELMRSFQDKYNSIVPDRDGLTDHLIANGVTVQEWISVKDRLPEKGGSYLVFSSKSKTVFTAHYWLGDRWSNRANGQFITHWMPLPEPPKEATP